MSACNTSSCKRGLLFSYMKVLLVSFHDHEYCSRRILQKELLCWLRTFTATLPSSSSTLKHFYLSPPLAFLSRFSVFHFKTKKKLMAESVISGLVQTIIENLGSQILQEIGKILDVKKSLKNSGIQFLESMLYLRNTVSGHYL